MKTAKSENRGASPAPGAVACGYCGVTSLGAAPGAPAPAAGVDPEIVRLLRADQKINAIKVYRDATNCGLRGAKDAVDDIEATLTRGR